MTAATTVMAIIIPVQIGFTTFSYSHMKMSPRTCNPACTGGMNEVFHQSTKALTTDWMNPKTGFTMVSYSHVK